jgi:hypothetical protein
MSNIVCDAIARQFDQDYNFATLCWRFECKEESKKRDNLQSSTLEVSLGRKESGMTMNIKTLNIVY